jgi:hypothetical protein
MSNSVNGVGHNKIITLKINYVLSTQQNDDDNHILS